MGWFSKKKKRDDVMPVSEGMPQIPMYPDISGEETGHVERPPEHPIEEKHDIEEHHERLPIVDTSIVNLPQRQPAFAQREETYPERASIATGKQVFEQPTVAREMPGEMPLGREARGPAVEEKTQGFTEKKYEPPESLVREVKEEEAKELVVDDDERPVFVKLEKYRDAMSSIESLKQQIKEMDYLLEKIEELRSKEQEELGKAKQDLNKIKEQLVGIDKHLFEV